MSVCEASWCRRRQNQRSLNFTFHSFPVRQPHLCWEWVKFTKKKLPWHPTAKSFLCSEHFEDNCFHCPDLRKTLKDDAVPTVILTKGNVVVLDKHNKSSKKAKAKNSSFHKHNESSKKAEAKNKSLHKHRKRKRKADTSVPGASPSQPAKSTDRGSHKEKISRSSKSPLKSNEPVIKRTSKNALHNVQPTDKAVKGTPGSEAALQQNKPGNMERAKENLRTIQPTEQSGLPQADVLIIAEIPKDTVHNVQPMEKVQDVCVPAEVTHTHPEVDGPLMSGKNMSATKPMDVQHSLDSDGNSTAKAKKLQEDKKLRKKLKMLQSKLFIKTKKISNMRRLICALRITREIFASPDTGLRDQFKNFPQDFADHDAKYASWISDQCLPDYPETIKMFALALYLCSRHAYLHVQKSFHLPNHYFLKEWSSI